MEQTKRENPLLAKLRIPGETFTLPSQGLFYTNELTEDVSNGEVHLLPMTAVDEIAFRSADKLFSGKAIEEVFLRRAPQIVNPMGLLAKDVDFILTCFRVLSYGPELEVTYDHMCSAESKTHSYIVDLQTFIRSTKRIDPTTLTTNYTITLQSGQTAKFRPIVFKDIVNIYQASEANPNMTEAQADELAWNGLASVIQSVDEVTDREFIKEWLQTLPIYMIDEVRRIVDNTLNWGPDFMTKQVCKDCKKEMEFMVTTNPISFFI